MILISVEQMLSSSSTSMIDLKCDGCQQEFQRIQKQIKSDYKLKSQTQHFCSNKCQASLIKKELVKLTCANCNIDFLINFITNKNMSKFIKNFLQAKH